MTEKSLIISQFHWSLRYLNFTLSFLIFKTYAASYIVLLITTTSKKKCGVDAKNTQCFILIFCCFYFMSKSGNKFARAALLVIESESIILLIHRYQQTFNEHFPGFSRVLIHSPCWNSVNKQCDVIGANSSQAVEQPFNVL